MRIAIGTLNPVKVNAVRLVTSAVWPDSTVEARAVESGVADQPKTLSEARLGAANRARRVLELTQADLGIGLEGYTWDARDSMFLSGWVEILHRDGRQGSGSSGSMLLPEQIAHAIRNGEELGPVMDRLSQRHNTKQGEGTVGILTAGHLKRTDAFKTALFCALTPFLSPDWYE